MRAFLKIVFVAAAVFAPLCQARAESFGAVAVTIAPLHSLVSGVTEGVNKAELIVPAEASPHGFNLKPSHIRKMSGVKAVFYIGDGFERFLSNALRSLPGKVRKIPVAEKSGIALLKTRRDDEWESDGHDHTGAYDMHIWLYPKNAEKIVKTATREMSRINPQKRNAYKKNARALIAKLRKLDANIRAELAGLENRPYVVFHDAYIHFERGYGLNAVGSIALNPENPPSAAAIKRIRAKIRQTGTVCVFSELQFGEKITRTAVEGTAAKTGVIDPLGAGLEPGPELYFQMMENLAREMKRCLS